MPRSKTHPINIYQALFIKSTEEHKRTEEYLATGFAQILSCGSNSFVSSVVQTLAGGAALSVAATVAECDDLRIKPEYGIQNGRIDLVLEGDGFPICAFEFKVTAPIQQGYGSVSEAAQPTQSHDQVEEYRRWMSEQANRHDMPESLLFLVTVLLDREDRNRPGSGALCHVVQTTWKAIADCLQNIAPSVDNDGIGLLCQHYVEYLKMEGVLDDELNSLDLAAAEMFLSRGAYQRIRNAFTKFRTMAKDVLPMNWGGYPRSLPYLRSEIEYASLEDYSKSPNGTLVNWGMFWADTPTAYWEGEKFDPMLTLRSGVFISIYTENGLDHSEKLTSQKPGWHISQSKGYKYIVAVEPIRSNEPGLEALSSEWLEQRLPEAATIVQACDKSVR